MRRLSLVLVLLVSATASAEERALDVSPVKEFFVVLKDGAGHVFAIIPSFSAYGRGDEVNWMFYGDGKVFHRLRHPPKAGLSGTDMFVWNLWDPRATQPDDEAIYFHDKKYELDCGKDVVPLTPLPAAEAKAVADGAKFYAEALDRQEYALARDDLGTYYYVDRAGGDQTDYHLWVGPRGALKLMKMKNVVSDSAGDVFATKKGELRLVLGKQSAIWVKGKKRLTLTWLPTEDNLALIYGALGVYAKLPLGLPCDDLVK